ncbi:hypothetical protein H4R35_003251 [Dimargaris xerosporica]|nr:hypothetical protein H4R35_003251 [Dimargaris xerosporica]
MSDVIVYKVTAPSLISRTRHLVNTTSNQIEYVKRGPVSSDNRIVFYRPCRHGVTKQRQAYDAPLTTEYETVPLGNRRYLKPSTAPIPPNSTQPTLSVPCFEPLTALPSLDPNPRHLHMSQPSLTGWGGLESSPLPPRMLDHLPLTANRSPRVFLDSVKKPTSLPFRRYTDTAMRSGVEPCNQQGSDNDDDGIDLLGYPLCEEKAELAADVCFNHSGYGPEFYRQQHSQRPPNALERLISRRRQPLHRLLTPHGRDPVVPSSSRPLSSSVYPQLTRSVTAPAKGLATVSPSPVDPMPGVVLWDVTTRRWRQQQCLNFINPRASVAHWVRVTQDPIHHKDGSLQYAFAWSDSQTTMSLPSDPDTSRSNDSSALHQCDQAAGEQHHSPQPFRTNSALGEEDRTRAMEHQEVAREYYWKASTLSSTLVCYERRSGLPIAKFKRRLWALTYSGKLFVVKTLVPSQAFLEFLLFSCLVVLELREH